MPAPGGDILGASAAARLGGHVPSPQVPHTHQEVIHARESVGFRRDIAGSSERESCVKRGRVGDAHVTGIQDCNPRRVWENACFFRREIWKSDNRNP